MVMLDAVSTEPAPDTGSPTRRTAAPGHAAYEAAGPPSTLLEQLNSSLADPSQRHMAADLLRVITRSVLDAIATREQETIEPFDRTLRFLTGRLSVDADTDDLDDDPRYLLGRLDALLDLCDVGLDQSLSKALVKEVQRAYARDVLCRLQAGRCTASELAEAVGLKGQASKLSNVLRWMEAASLVRRAEVGRTTLVSMGPAGQAALDAVHALEASSSHLTPAPHETKRKGERPVAALAASGGANGHRQTGR